ncbi:MAG TPA: cation acetate symporter [Acidothermaceae bacterium]
MSGGSMALVAVIVVTLITMVVGALGVRVARTPDDFLVAARAVPPLRNAAAISGEYLSAASFLGVAGLLLKDGLGMLWYPVGYAAGYLMLLLLVAAPLRRFGAYTIPDFAEGRLGAPRLRQVATIFVLVIGWFYLLPQLKGAGLTLEVLLGTPYWVGVAVLAVVVTSNIAAGGMKGVTFVQSVQYWIKLMAIATPAIVLIVITGGLHRQSLTTAAPPFFATTTTVKVQTSVAFVIEQPVTVQARGSVDGAKVDGPVTLTVGTHRVESGAELVFPAGSATPHAEGLRAQSGSSWVSPLVNAGHKSGHPLAATYSLIVATFLGTLGLPHILVRFYTNRNGRAARRTTVIVLGLLGVFYLFPAAFAVLARLRDPGLYVTGQTDSVVLVLPHALITNVWGEILGALVAAGAFAAFLSTSSGLLVSVAGAMAHDLLRGGVRTFRRCALLAGFIGLLAGLQVQRFDLNLLVGWCFAIAASTFCPLLVLGIWWRSLTWVGAIAGLVLGGVSSSAAIIMTMLGVGSSGWPSVLLGQPAIWTVPLAFVAMIVGSRLTPAQMPADLESKLLQLHLPEALRPVAPVAD